MLKGKKLYSDILTSLRMFNFISFSSPLQKVFKSRMNKGKEKKKEAQFCCTILGFISHMIVYASAKDSILLYIIIFLFFVSHYLTHVACIMQ